MKKLIFEEMLLISLKEKGAKRIIFDRNLTLVLGKNSTGKSALLKSIYRTFGAEPNKMNVEWAKLNPHSLIKFNVDDIKYSILRTNNLFTIFDGKDKVLLSTEKVTRELSPFLSEMLDYKVTLKNRSAEMVTPPSQYMFLPFYVDQDASWSNSWDSFSRLTQFSGWKKDLINFFGGINSNEYYEIKSQIGKLKLDLVKTEEERLVLSRIIEKIKKDGSETPTFNINPDKFREDVEQLLSQVGELRKIENTFKEELIILYNFKSSIEKQIHITKHAISEISADYKFVTEDIIEEEIECPTCGAEYENSFVERFFIAKDEDKCKDLLIRLKTELNDINGKISAIKKKYAENTEAIFSADRHLSSKLEIIRNSEMLISEGRKDFKKGIDQELGQLSTKKSEIEAKLKDLNKQLRKQNNKDHKKAQIDKFKDFMTKFMSELEVEQISKQSLDKLNPKIDLTGSQQPRALLAYYFSMLNILQESNNSAFCPIIIDSPNQQAQDGLNIVKVLKFIRDNQPKNSQLILGLEDTHGIAFNCPIIELNKKYELLNRDEYSDEIVNFDYFFKKTI